MFEVRSFTVYGLQFLEGAAKLLRQVQDRFLKRIQDRFRRHDIRLSCQINFGIASKLAERFDRALSRLYYGFAMTLVF